MSREGRETMQPWDSGSSRVGPPRSCWSVRSRHLRLSADVSSRCRIPRFPKPSSPTMRRWDSWKRIEARISSRTAIVQRVAALSVKATLDDFATAGHRILRAGLVVGSLTNPRSISNPHIRAHALEGQLFRRVLAGALEAHGLLCSVVLERDVYTKAAVTLARSEDDVKHAVSALGRSLGGPWRAEEKLAAVVAWMNLS